MIRTVGAALAAFVISLALSTPAPQGRAQTTPCSTVVPPGGDLQLAIINAAPGDTICLMPGLYVGSYEIQGKSWLTIRGWGQDWTVLASGGRDNVLVFNSNNIRIEGLTLYVGRPANAYVNASSVTFANVQAAGGAIGLHFDAGSSGVITGSRVHSHASDGVLVRGDSSLDVDNSWIAINGGVGVSSAGLNRYVNVSGNVIAYNGGPGFFTGSPPCALLPPGVLEAPGCYLLDIQAYVIRAGANVFNNIILGNGSTGLVFFPGTSGTVSYNQILGNHLTGLFAWGAKVDASGNRFDRNDEHAIEYRAFPDPENFEPSQALWPLRAGGVISANVITRTLPLNNWLGGGVLSQGAALHVDHNRIESNAGIAVSFVNRAIGDIRGNVLRDNGGAAVCLWNVGFIDVRDNEIAGNLSDQIGACDQQGEPP